MNKFIKPCLICMLMVAFAWTLAGPVAAQVYTTGPTPPPGVNPAEPHFSRAQVVIPGVPPYIWQHGCGPTAVGMVVGYWDALGCPNMVPGDASTQTSAVNAMIADDSDNPNCAAPDGDHYQDYSCPLDDFSGVLPDRSETGGAHASNCVADFMRTSFSADGLPYGWSYISNTPVGFVDYVNLIGPEYNPTASNIGYNDFSWDDYKARIDAGRPVVLSVDCDGDGEVDHATTGIGYDDATMEYGIYDTWSDVVRWETWHPVTDGDAWGIFCVTIIDVEAGLVEETFLYLNCPDCCDLWTIKLNDAGYSDFLLYGHYGAPPHEMLSGEWAAAIRYGQMPESQWLTRRFIYPSWMTNTDFVVTVPLHYPNPADHSKLRSVISDGMVDIEIIATMYCSRTAMGVAADPAAGRYVPSDSCFMVHDYYITNISGEPIEDLYFYQFLHGHPGNREDATVTGAYDSDFYPIVDPQFPLSQYYHYDITQWAAATWDGFRYYLEYIGFGGIREPSAYDLWHFRGHGPRPPDGLHVRVEDGNLMNVSSWGPDQTAGAEEWYLGTLDAEEIDSISVLLSVAVSPVPIIMIEKTHDTYQGYYEYVSITIENSELLMGGFDFLVAYDASALTAMEVAPGQLLEDCGWEYFTYRFNWNGNCGGPCPSGLLRIIAIADINNGPNHPSCFGPPDLDVHELAEIKFYVTNDYTFECQYVPIRFFWHDCGDNAISNVQGDELYISDRVFDVDGDEITGDIHYGGHWWLGDCQNPDTTKPDAIPFPHFYHGGIDIICIDSIDLRGDINLNQIPNEIADAVLFTNYFILGLGVFDINPAGQIAATDVNNDGRVLTVGDLVYLVRIITGDELPFFKLTPYAEAVEVTIADGGTVLTRSSASLGAALFVFDVGDEIGSPDLLAEGMKIKSGIVDGQLRVLIWSDSKAHIPAGDSEIFTLSGQFELIEASVSDYYGNLMRVDIGVETVPTSFALHQNYPNPFNAMTDITIVLPQPSEWKLEIFNITGQLVESFHGYGSGVIPVRWDATEVASGVYFYKATAGKYTDIKKMVLLK